LDENQRQREAIGRLAGATGITGPANVAAIMHSSAVMYRAMDLVGSLVELGGGAALPFTSDISDAEAFEYSHQFFVTTLHGSPTRLLGLAKYLNKERKQLPNIKQIVYGGEHLSDNQLQFLRDVFGWDLWVSSFLASAEVGPYGVQPPWLPRGHFIIDMVVTWIEILNADEDGVGTIALTNLARKRIPLIRYDSGDVGRLISAQPKSLNWIKDYYNITSKETYFSDDSTTSSSPRYTVLEFKGRNTKKSFQFWTAYYPLERFTIPLGKVPGILQFQILLEQRSMQDYMTILVVPEESMDKAQLEAKVKKTLEYSFGDSAYLNICRVLFTSLENLEKGKRGGKVLPLVDTRV
jgi:phenylacetate-coenzyme A ligase PaaK-like adenylate-forming protein